MNFKGKSIEVGQELVMRESDRFEYQVKVEAFDQAYLCVRSINSGRIYFAHMEDGTSAEVRSMFTLTWPKPRTVTVEAPEEGMALAVVPKRVIGQTVDKQPLEQKAGGFIVGVKNSKSSPPRSWNEFMGVVA